MKLALIGSTGFVGTALLPKLLKAGHQVKVLVRSPEKLGDLRNQVDVIQGDMFDRAALERLIQGVDVVISAAGPPRNDKHDSEQHADSLRMIVDVMKTAGVSRIITIAGAAAKIPGQQLGIRQRVLRVLLERVATDLIRTKDIEVGVLAESGLNWTIVRPPIIRAGKTSRKFIARDDDLVSMWVNVEDMAEFMVSLLQTHEWDRRAPVVIS